MLGATLVAPAEEIDYTKGVFVVNEDWYGHQNSTVNYLLPEDSQGNYWHYRVIQTENPGKELGCTNQFGAIWKNRFYLIAKQAKDPGASVEGGRITVADATTLRILHQSPLIDPSGAVCDGRGFVGIDDRKGYISTSNGIWILNLSTYETEGQVEGTANPTPSNLYKGQCGTMVEAEGRIFAAHQSLGLLVIDPEEDKVTDIVGLTCVSETAAIGSVVKSRDGYLWLSVAKNANGTGATLPYIVKVNPKTLETTVIPLPSEIYPPSNSWYAWTPDSFCASGQTNSLYWGGGANSWFSNTRIFRYDIDSGSFSEIINLEKEGENWKLYGCSMRVHPENDEIYISLYRDFSDQTYITRRYTTSGHIIREYSMIANYWFPSVFVFPEKQGASSETIGEDIMAPDTGVEYYTILGQKVMPDNLKPGLYIRKVRNKTEKIIIK